MLGYWDGTAWTNDRRPKQAPPPPPGSSTVGDVFAETYDLAKKMLLPSLAMAAVWVTAVVAMIAAAFLLLRNSNDDGIAPAAVASLVIIFAIGVFGAAVGILGCTRLAAARHNGLKLTMGDALRGGIRRVPRSLFFFLAVALGVVAILVAASLIAVLTGPLAILVAPAFLGAVIWLWPYMTISSVIVAAGPSQPGPFTALKEFVSGQWVYLAIRILVFNIVIFLTAIALQLMSAAVGGGDIGTAIVLIVINFVVQFFLNLYQYSMPIVLYAMGNGPLDTELTKATEPPAPDSTL